LALFTYYVGYINQNNTPGQPSPSPIGKTIFIGNAKLNAEIADTPSTWTTGLSNRPSLAPNAGMLFIFPTSEIRTFWMKDTLIPLDIIWVNNKKVIGVDQMFPELTTSISNLKQFYSPSEANAVIEVNIDWVKNNNI